LQILPVSTQEVASIEGDLHIGQPTLDNLPPPMVERIDVDLIPSPPLNEHKPGDINPTQSEDQVIPPFESIPDKQLTLPTSCTIVELISTNPLSGHVSIQS